MNVEQRGLTLDFYRSARGIDHTAGGLSSRFDTCTLVGTVDYRKVHGASDRPEIRPLAPGGRVSPVRPDAPAVWLVVGKYIEDDRFLIPADPEFGQPHLSVQWMAGGNYATTTDSRFRELLPITCAVRVLDRREI
ncbi:hypothetical protein JNUCC0626_40300 [Lentzea sp. JNUCC 0626]|uniref:hypothetical protein n=1 Tax=Lentzea sp. JNUCC 0626 TaxID=3367513 RepID=UPI00374A1EF2